MVAQKNTQKMFEDIFGICKHQVTKTPTNQDCLPNSLYSSRHYGKLLES